MSKRRRVLELAKELGYANQELVTKINDLGIGIRVSNVMTALTEDEVVKIKGALKKAEASSKKSTASAATNGGAPAPIKRRSKSTPAATVIEAGDDIPTGDSVGPVLRRKPKRASNPLRRVVAPAAEATEAEVAASDEVATSEEAAPVAAAAVEAKDATAEVAAQAPAEVVEPTPVVAEAAPEAKSDDVKEEAPVAARAEAAPAVDAVAEDAAVVEEKAPEAKPEEAVAAKAPEATTPAKPAEPKKEESTSARVLSKPAPKPSTPASPGADAKGARVLGHIDLGTIQNRMEGRSFEVPGSADRGDGRRRNKGRRRDNDRGASSGGRSVRDVRSLYVNDRKGNRNKGNRRPKPKKTEITTAAEHKRVVRIEDTITVGELGREMGAKAGLLALKLMEMGMKATVNTTLDFETAQLIALEFDHTVENVAFDIARFYDTSSDEEGTMQPRPPVVTVMGHVDHGKTSLLDAIRASSVTTTEAGGITQHIGAYTVQTDAGGLITFLDTPGHEAFTALRARGAQATDIVVLVVAADDGVMPQTVEAINHSRAAGVPIIVAVNKIDKPSANPDRVKQALIEYELTPEAWGGDTQYVEVSALKGLNITELVEQIAVRAELEEFTARPDRDAQGIVIESRLDTGRGPLATVLVQRGTLNVGDIVVVGEHYGRVRTMADHRNVELQNAGPSVPAEITGLGGVPEAGEPFFVVPEERAAKMITAHVAEQHRQRRMADLAKSGMDKLMSLISEGGIRKKLKVIVKGDVQGSIEALKGSFGKIGNEEVSIDVIHSAVGGVTENDVNLAASSEDAVVIVGFNVRADNRAVEVAEKYDIQILTFNIIYDAIDTLRQLVEGMLSPLQEENVIGQAEVRETFHAPKIGTIAGCYVTQGQLRRNSKARLYRDGKLVYESSLASLRRFKDDVREVKNGFECGTSLENFNDIKVGDIIEAFEVVEVAATL